jgi:threonylcarbamoyladenosine tRNA methylthiotransferase MtaB
MPKFHVQTFGCRCNQADSAAIREGLYRCSMVECDTPQDADLIVVNTCTVTHRADQQARQAIRKLHRENPAARVIVTGCYAERDPETIAALPGVKLVLGNAAKERLPEIVERPQKTAGEKIIRTPLDFGPECLMAPMSQTGGKTRPYVKLQDGCDAHCSYCIVPKVRGPGRSVRPEDVLAEIGTLVHKGFQEIVLTGINLGAYGRKFENKTRLGELVRQIVKIPGLGRIRLSSIEPMHFERSLVQLALESPVIARHFHIPMQSGSDRILRLMRRPYRSARFRDLLGYIRNELPGAGLGTDVLVGFPCFSIFCQRRNGSLLLARTGSFADYSGTIGHSGRNCR